MFFHTDTFRIQHKSSNGTPLPTYDPTIYTMIQGMQEMMRQNANLTQHVLQNQGSQAGKELYVMLNFSKTVPTFKGEEGPLEAKIWLKQVKAATKTNQ